ncbi:MAG: DUF1273 family protein [Alistipes sp.]|nr:DUF1273 family protein [Alistipes sp.]
MCDRDTTACFTGHRSYNGCRDRELEAAIRELYASGYRTFLGGMAMGFDLSAAEKVLALRDELAGLRFVAVVPFEGMQRGFSESWRLRFEAVVAASDECITLAPRYSAGVYAVRNNYLVDNSSAIIAYFTGEKGGTAYTVRRATKRLLRLINIYNNPQLQLVL